MGNNAFEVRTDLAFEAREDLEKKGQELSGVTVKEEKHGNIHVTTVAIETKEAEERIGKAQGKYLTLETDESVWRGNGESELEEVIAEYIRELIPEDLRRSVLVVGLGNRQVTPDALGPWVVDRLCINRHFNENGDNMISAVAPGVMAQTGIETADLIKGVVDRTKPTAVIALDALAARNVRRLNTTIQLSDAGISPGSGVGNHRHAINKESMGVPVIAVGIPTVVDAVTIVNDTMGTLLDALDIEYASFTEEERRQLVFELIEERMKTMFLTPKNVDESVVNMSDILAHAICKAVRA